MKRRYTDGEVEAWRSKAAHALSAGRYAKDGVVIMRRQSRLGVYAINISHDAFHGWALFESGEIVPGYPHMWNYDERIMQYLSPLSILYGEKKYNGANIRWTVLEDGAAVVATRNVLTPRGIPVFSLSRKSIEETRSAELRRELVRRAEALKEAGYPFVEVVGDGEYFLVKLPDAFHYARQWSGGFTVPLDALKRYVFFFELYGWPVTIVIAENKRGLYPIDYGRPLRLVLIDVFDKRELRFLTRREKEEVTTRYGMPVVEVVFRVRGRDLPGRAPALRRLAEESGEEGFVLKSDEIMFKLKAGDVIELARRLTAIERGEIYHGDLAKAVSRGLSSVSYNPAAFEDAVRATVEELNADYPAGVVERNMEEVRLSVLKTLINYYALEYAKRRIDELAGQGVTGKKAFSIVFRELNEYIPRTIPAAREYIDPEAERRLMEAGDPRWRQLKLTRKRMLNEAVNYILARVQPGGGGGRRARREAAGGGASGDVARRA